MQLTNASAEILVPDGKTVEDAMKRTTVIGVGAHQDDLEMMALAGIVRCRREPGQWFTGITCTDGSGSPRAGTYADMTNEEMMRTRWQEQRVAASIGRYSAIIQLKHTSAATKDSSKPALLNDLKQVFSHARPTVVFTHNPADKHDTHVAVMCRTIEALRAMPRDSRPDKVYGTEIWRDLDWLPDDAKIVLDLTGSEHTAAALMGAFDSQIAGGKRYDLGAIGRWRANATFFSSHSVDTAELASFAMDLTPLVHDASLDIVDYVSHFVDKLRDDIRGRLKKFG